MARKFISKAIGEPGALRRKAGLAPKGDEPIPASKLASLERSARRRGDTKTLRQINLARTLRKLGKRRRSS